MAASVTGCSFVAPGLASDVFGQVPTFSYRDTFHSDDYFGVQATFLSGGRTCYGAAPTFTPYITNSAASFSRNCVWNYQFPYYTALLCNGVSVTDVPDGPLTINYRGAAVNSVSPIPFTALFGPSPAVATVTQRAVVTSNTVASMTASPIPASTVTATQSGVPITDYSTVQVIQPTTSTSTVTVSSCSTPSSSSIASSSSSSSSRATSSSSSTSPSTTLSSASTLSNPPSSSSSTSSLSPSPSSSSRPLTSSSPSPTSSSVAALSSPSLSPSSSPSPISSSSPSPTPSSSLSPSSSSPTLSPSSSSSTNLSPSSSSSSTSSASPSSSPSPSSSSVASSTPVASPSSTTIPVASTTPTCSADDGKIFSTSNGDFIIECFSDRNNNDLGPASPQPADFSTCMNVCAQTSGCLAVSYVPNGPCYLKNGLGAPGSNNNIWGARRVSGVSPSSSVTTAPTQSSTSASTPVASTASCPGSNGQTIDTAVGSFVIECYLDRAGFDMSNSPVYPGSYEGCVNACASRSGCVDISYNSGGPCYLKNGIGNPSNNGNVIGGRLLSASQSAASASSPATSSPVVTTSQPVASPTPARTITVTTTVSDTVYQCTCEPSNTSVPFAGAVVTCPNGNGQTYTSECGATYAIECSADRYGNDLNAPLPQVNSLNECLKACDNTAGCVDVSYVAGTPGPCYMKSSIGAIRQNSNIWGGRQLSGCTSSTQKLKLHRKRVVHAKSADKPIQKRGIPYGPDFTYISSTTTVTSTSTSFSTTSTTTVIPSKSGVTTTTVFTTARVTSTVTQTVPSTAIVRATTTTCPRPSAF